MKLIWLVALVTFMAYPSTGFLDVFKELASIGRQELWDRGRMDFFGYECNWSRVPKLNNFKIRFKATVHCPGFTPYTGQGWDGNPEKAVNEATIDFVKKAQEGKFITEDEARPWLE